MPHSRYRIGELARAAAVSVQTLRHYDKIGLLQPSTVSPSGYRLYSDADRTRLDLIRALRSLDFDLKTIARLVHGTVDLAGAAKMHLAALEFQARTLNRRRAILRLMMREGREITTARLGRLQALSTLDRFDREKFLRENLRKRLSSTSSAVAEGIFALLANLPDDLTDGQLEAFLELAELVSEPAFLARYQKREHASASRSQATVSDKWRGQQDAVFSGPARAARARIDPESTEGRAILAKWLRQFARLNGRAITRGRNWLVEEARSVLAQLDDPAASQEARFWDLMAVLRPELTTRGISVSWKWIRAALASAAVARTRHPLSHRGNDRKK